ncbi:hypothetical protein PLANTIT3_20040 [Plantibacter sp. T3]|nr:hypothetical protein PLANTIT3_20040 [Plantibacter sp. T3]
MQHDRCAHVHRLWPEPAQAQRYTTDAPPNYVVSRWTGDLTVKDEITLPLQHGLTFVPVKALAKKLLVLDVARKCLDGDAGQIHATEINIALPIPEESSPLLKDIGVLGHTSRHVCNSKSFDCEASVQLLAADQDPIRPLFPINLLLGIFS